MRLILHAAIFVTTVVASLAPTAIMTTTASASPAKSTGQAAKGCVRVTATIPVGAGPFGVAVDPKTKTIYVANSDSNTVSVLAACPK